MYSFTKAAWYHLGIILIHLCKNYHINNKDLYLIFIYKFKHECINIILKCYLGLPYYTIKNNLFNGRDIRAIGFGEINWPQKYSLQEKLSQPECPDTLHNLMLGQQQWWLEDYTVQGGLWLLA